MQSHAPVLFACANIRIAWAGDFKLHRKDFNTAIGVNSEGGYRGLEKETKDSNKRSQKTTKSYQF